MERLSFRLNVIDGRTESIDKDWDYIRHLRGIPDGSNNMWQVEEDDVELSEMYLDDAMLETYNSDADYHADISEFEWSYDDCEVGSGRVLSRCTD